MPTPVWLTSAPAAITRPSGYARVVQRSAIRCGQLAAADFAQAVDQELELPSTHFRPRHRLVEAVGYDSAGTIIGASRFDPTLADVYPCTKPKDYGYGVLKCP